MAYERGQDWFEPLQRRQPPLTVERWSSMTAKQRQEWLATIRQEAQERLASAARNKPASIDPTSTPTGLTATARYVGAQIARLFGLPELNAEEYVTLFKNLDVPGGGLLRGVANPQLGTAYIDQRTADTGVLAHELTHIYLLRESGIDTDDETLRWVNEGLANYASDVLGLTTHNFGVEAQPVIGDPTEGYSTASRFFIWMESRWPGSVSTLAKRISAGEHPAPAMADLTGIPTTDMLLTLYEKEPLDPDAVGKMARYLRPQSQDPLREKTLMREHQAKRPANFGRNMGRTTPSEVRQYKPPKTSTITLGGITINLDADEDELAPKPKKKARPKPLPGVVKSQ